LSGSIRGLGLDFSYLGSVVLGLVGQFGLVCCQVDKFGETISLQKNLSVTALILLPTAVERRRVMKRLENCILMVEK
jgi:hypothetical protein